jgi:hypothetical protein
MLMFGPKMAPTKLKQFVHLYSEFEEEISLHTEPHTMVIFNLSFCEGVPMADIFKVLQYWVFTTSDDKKSCDVSIGMSVHYLKSSLFKSQIFSGAKDEMTGQIEAWSKYMPALLKKKKHVSHRPGEGGSEASHKPGGAAVGGVEEESEGESEEESEEPSSRKGGEGEDEVLIITSKDENRRASRRLSFNGKNITITPTMTHERQQDFLFYGMNAQIWVTIILIVVVCFQTLFIWRLSSEIASLQFLIFKRLNNI